MFFDRNPKRTNLPASAMRFTRTAGRHSFSAMQNGLKRTMRAATALPRATIELVFPPACASCGSELDPDESPLRDVRLCDPCYDSIDVLHEPMCRRCGGPLPLLSNPGKASEPADAKTPAGCYRCRGRRKMWFDETVAAGLYEGRLRELLLTMKTDQGDPLSLVMGHLLWNLRRERLQALDIDVVAPIPLHWRRRLSHRTNSAALVAEVLATRLRVPLADGLLRRRRPTQPQSELTPPKRWENVRHAFSLGGGYHLTSAHVLLVDDILTTGATCSAAARVLRKSGAARVTVAVVGRAIGH